MIQCFFTESWSTICIEEIEAEIISSVFSRNSRIVLRVLSKFIQLDEPRANRGASESFIVSSIMHGIEIQSTLRNTESYNSQSPRNSELGDTLASVS